MARGSVDRPRGRATGSGTPRARNSPEPRSTFSSPSSTTMRPRLSTVSGQPLYAHALVGRVADASCIIAAVIVTSHLRIPDRDVGVGADRDRALARVQAVHARVVGRGERDELVERQAPLHHAFGEQERQAHLEPGHAVRHLLEGGLLAASASCRSRRTGTARGRRSSTWNVPSASPSQIASCAASSRGGGLQHHFAPSTPGLVHVGRREEQVLRAGLGVDPRAEGLRGADRLHRLGARDVDDQHRHVEQAREHDDAVRRLGLGERVVATSWNFGAPWPRSSRRFAIQRIMSWFSACTITSAPSRSATLEDVEQLVVVEPQQVVGHVDLERGDAAPDHRRQLLVQHLARSDRR